MSPDLLLIAIASFFAGTVDSIVGGGGLILVPTLFATYPTTAPPTLFGTNKCASICGTSLAAWRYAQRVTLQWRWLGPAAAAALIGSLIGTWCLTQLDAAFLRKLLPVLLAAVLIYTLANKHLGLHHAPRHSERATLLIAMGIGLGIGWYDGFFGPGTGSFFIFLMVRLLGFDFLNASAASKVLNVSTNLATVALLGMQGYIWWQVGLVLAVANVAGSFAGTYLALRHGTALVRRVFVVVVLALILKTGYDAYWVPLVAS